MRGPISPPLSRRTPLASFGGWVLTMTCPTCGLKVRSLDDLMKKVGAHREIGSVFSRISCDRCGANPTKLIAKQEWVSKFGREIPQIDLSEYLSDEKSTHPPAAKLAG